MHLGIYTHAYIYTNTSICMYIYIYIYIYLYTYIIGLFILWEILLLSMINSSIKGLPTRWCAHKHTRPRACTRTHIAYTSTGIGLYQSCLGSYNECQMLFTSVPMYSSPCMLWETYHLNAYSVIKLRESSLTQLQLPLTHSLDNSTAILLSNQIKSIFVYLMLKSTSTVTDAKMVYRILLGGQCYTNWHKKYMKWE